MIELIFAIIIISISIISLPMMTQATASAVKGNLVQEAIFASVTEINIATAFAWDDASLLDESASSLSRVINTDGTCIVSGVNYKRIGHISRQCLSDNTIRVDNTSNTEYYDSSMQSFAHTWQPLYEISSSREDAEFKKTGYKTACFSSLDINYPPLLQFGETLNNVNIKEIVLRVQDEENKTVTLLRTYSANIGEVAYASRLLQ